MAGELFPLQFGEVSELFRLNDTDMSLFDAQIIP